MATRIDYFANDAIRQNLKQKTVRGGAAIAASRLAAVAIQFVCIPVLSRLLAPDDFGVIAMAMVFTGFAQLFVDAGLSAATIQRENITPQQASNLFWFATSIGVGLALVTVALALPISWLYGRPEVAAVTATLALTFVLSGATVQHTALMGRAMRFTAISLIQVVASLAAQSVTIYLAWTWRSYWALVGGQLTLAGVALVATWVACGWRPRMPARGAGTRSMVEFGASLSAAKFINYLSRSGDKLLIGSTLGSGVLGFYERAYKVLLFPIQSINNPLTSVMLPALSRLVDQPGAYRRTYFSALRIVALAGLPLVAFAAIDAERLIPVVLGERWAPSVPIFRALTPAAFFGAFSSAFGWIYISRGRGIDNLKWHVYASLAALAGFAAGLPWGAVGVAAGFSLSRMVVLPLGVRLAYRDTPLTVGELVRTLRPVVIGVAVASAVAMATKANLTFFQGEPSLASVAALALLMGAVYAALLYSLGVRSLMVKPVDPTPPVGDELKGS